MPHSFGGKTFLTALLHFTMFQVNWQTEQGDFNTLPLASGLKSDLAKHRARHVVLSTIDTEPQWANATTGMAASVQVERELPWYAPQNGQWGAYSSLPAKAYGWVKTGIMGYDVSEVPMAAVPTKPYQLTEAQHVNARTSKPWSPLPRGVEVFLYEPYTRQAARSHSTQPGFY